MTWRVVPLSLSPSCVTRKKPREKEDFTRPFFPAVFSRVTHDRLSERGTTRGLRLLWPVSDWIKRVSTALLLFITFSPFSWSIYFFVYFFLFPFLFLLSYWSRLQLQVRLRNLNFRSRQLHPVTSCFGADKHSVVFCVSTVSLVCQGQSRIEQYQCITILHRNETRLMRRRISWSKVILHAHTW